jgi:hypothetical protein
MHWAFGYSIACIGIAGETVIAQLELAFDRTRKTNGCTLIRMQPYNSRLKGQERYILGGRGLVGTVGYIVALVGASTVLKSV